MFTIRSLNAASAVPDFALDLGTSKIALYARGEGVIAEEAACLAMKLGHTGLKAVIAIGQKAVDMIGKAPSGVQILTPIQSGVISDSESAALIVRFIINKLKLKNSFQGKNILITTLLGANSIELKAFREVGLLAGGRSAVMVPEPLAAAIGVGLPIEDYQARMVVDIGGGASEAVVTSCGRIVAGGSVRIGGDGMNAAISQFVMRQYGLKIANQEAQRLRECVVTDSTVLVLAARGIDTVRKRPAEINLSNVEILKTLLPCFDRIKSMVVDLVARLPVELAADLGDSGMVLTGGGSIQKNLQNYLAEATGISVTLHRASSHAVILGAGKLLRASSQDYRLPL